MPEKQTNQERLKEITERIEAGIRDILESGDMQKYQEYLRTMSRFHRYSVNNQMLIHLQCPNATLVAGYSKWEKQFSRHVMQGEKGITIIAPTPYKKKIEQEKLDPDTKLPLLDENGDVIVEEKEIKIPMFRPVKVFDYTATVKSILSRPVYLGHMVQGRKRQSFYEGKPQSCTPQSEWKIVEHTHEAIIDRELFDAVQSLSRTQKEAYRARLGKFDDMAHSENILKGLVYCRHCGRPLVRYKNVSHGKKLWYTFICPTHAQNPDSCPFVSIREDELLEILNASVQTQIALACDMDSLVTRKNAAPAFQQNRSAAEKKLDAARRTLKRSQSLYDSLYQNYVEQLITESEYAALKARYQAERLEAERLIAELEAHATEQRQLTQENAFLTGFQAYQGQTTLDSEMAHALIARIEIDADRNTNISFRYRDEYLALAAYLEEGAQ